MKIAAIGAKGLPAYQGGIEHHCQELYSRIVERGHSVDLFARCSYTECFPMQTKYLDGIKIISLPSLKLRGVDALVSSAMGAIAASKTNYDIIHFHALGPALFSRVSRAISAAKIVVTCHGLDWQRAKWGKFPKFLLHQGEINAVRCADKIIVVSEDLHFYFRQTYDIETVYIPNAAASYTQSDPNFTYGNSLSIKPGRYILFLGRVVPEKRPELLIKAFQALNLPDWQLVVVGGCSDSQHFTSEVVELAANNPNIIFTGELRGASLAEIVRGAGLFVLPSDLEGLPMVMLEAMKEGIPVVASDIPINKQLTEEGRGLVFTAGSLSSCISSLQWATNHPKEMRLAAQKAQAYVKANYNWDEIASGTLQLYSSLLGSENKQVLADNKKLIVRGR